MVLQSWRCSPCFRSSPERTADKLTVNNPSGVATGSQASVTRALSGEINCSPCVETDRGSPVPSAATVSIGQLVAFYEQKTTAILQRYGPGPRVHFHTGFADEPQPDATAGELRLHLVESQER